MGLSFGSGFGPGFGAGLGSGLGRFWDQFRGPFGVEFGWFGDQFWGRFGAGLGPGLGLVLGWVLGRPAPKPQILSLEPFPPHKSQTLGPRGIFLGLFFPLCPRCPHNPPTQCPQATPGLLPSLSAPQTLPEAQSQIIFSLLAVTKIPLSCLIPVFFRLSRPGCGVFWLQILSINKPSNSDGFPSRGNTQWVVPGLPPKKRDFSKVSSPGSIPGFLSPSQALPQPRVFNFSRVTDGVCAQNNRERAQIQANPPQITFSRC